MPRSDRDERVERLQQKAQERSANAVAAAKRAIMALQSHGRPVSIRTVAEEAGVSESFLTKNADLRAQISALHTPTPRSRARPGDAPSRKLAALQTKLDVVVGRLAELEAENKQLRDENANLRGALLEARRSVRSAR